MSTNSSINPWTFLVYNYNNFIIIIIDALMNSNLLSRDFLGGVFLFITIILLFLIILVFVVTSYNKMKESRIKIGEAKANITVYLEQRYDEISAIHKVVQEFKLHEQETLKELVELRSLAINSSDDFEKVKNINNSIENKIPSVLVTLEAYPELKSNQGFLDLQESIAQNEDNISASRRTFNSYVNRYNIEIAMFPTSILANIFNFKKEKLYEAPINKQKNPLL